METIKPIETEYNGYRFRSRLEARWAVFFDALNIKYEYEPEGFELSNGERYLPDFYLTDLGYYAEVKGFSEHIQNDLVKIEQFVRDNHAAVIILSNLPYDKEAKGLYWFLAYCYSAKYCRTINSYRAFFHSYEDLFLETWISDDYLVGCKYGYYVSNYICRCESDDSLVSKIVFEKIQAISGSVLDDDDVEIKDSFDLIPVEDALLKARQARFEYGETPS